MTMPALVAGVLSGLADLLVFLLVHHFWITPIWFIPPLGLVIAAIGGAVMGWAFTELLPGLPPRPWTTFAMAALATALAGFAFALGPGHNIPLIGGTPGVGKEVMIMMAIILVSAQVLVETHYLLTGT